VSLQSVYKAKLYNYHNMTDKRLAFKYVLTERRHHLAPYCVCKPAQEGRVAAAASLQTGRAILTMKHRHAIAMIHGSVVGNVLEALDQEALRSG